MNTFVYAVFLISILYVWLDDAITTDPSSPCVDLEAYIDAYMDEKYSKIFDKFVGFEDAMELWIKMNKNNMTLITIKNELIDTKVKLSDIQNQLDDTRNQLDDTRNQLDDTRNQLDDTRNQLDDTRNQLDDTRNQLNDTGNQLDDTRNQLHDRKMDDRKLKYIIETIKLNPFPIGFIYVQLPYEKSPNELWPWMAWDDVSSAYAGIFFRVRGGDAASFGQVQDDNSPRLTGVQRTYSSDGKNDTKTKYHFDAISVPKAGWSEFMYSGEFHPIPRLFHHFLRFEMSCGEVRPRNMAIRVWKRM